MARARTAAGVEDLSKAATPEPDVKPEEVATGAVAASDPRDEQLRGFQDFKAGSRFERVMQHDAHMRVLNVPADRCVTWATDPRIDNGRAIAVFKGLGFRLVEIDEVTSDPNDETKLHPRFYEEGPNRSVAMGGGVLMIGYRKYRDDRKAHEREMARVQVEEQQEKLDNLGIRHGGTVTRGGLKEV